MGRTKLRDYQVSMVDSILRDQGNGYDRVYGVLPTGCGKTRVASELIYRRLMIQHERCLWIVHTRELVRQAADAIRNVVEDLPFDVSVGIMMADEDDWDADIVVASIQTISTAKRAVVGPFGLVIVDECHHISPDSTYDYVLSNLAGDPDVVGITATPFRNDTRRMQEILPRCSFERTIPDMIREGWLCDLNYVQIPIEGLDLSELRIVRKLGEGDFSERQIAPLVEDGKIVNQTVDQTRPYIEKRSNLPALAFCASIQHAQALAGSYNYVGIKSAAIWGQMPKGDREKILRDWFNGDLQLVTNCSVLTEGFDYPRISTVIIARPTMSVGLYTQMIGRGTRLADDKDDCLILDITGRMPAKARPIHLDDILGEEISQENGAVTSVTKKELSDVRPRMHALRDPLGRSRFIWTRHPNLDGVWFAPVNAKLTAVMIPDFTGSGLYLAYVAPKEGFKIVPLRRASNDWVPMRQAIADLEFSLAKAGVVSKTMAFRSSEWRYDLATDKQLRVLEGMSKVINAQAVAEAWSKGDVSLAIDAMMLRKSIYNEMYALKNGLTK